MNLINNLINSVITHRRWASFGARIHDKPNKMKNNTMIDLFVNKTMEIF